MPGHPHCSIGDPVTDADHKRARRRGGKSFQPINLLASQKSTRGRPTNKAKKFERLKNLPQDVPIEEHPFTLFLAAEWEDAEAEIDVRKRKQDDVRLAFHTFLESYSQDKSNPQNIGNISQAKA